MWHVPCIEYCAMDCAIIYGIEVLFDLIGSKV